MRAVAASIFVTVTAVIASTAPKTFPILLGAFWIIDGILALSSAVHSTRPEERSELLVFAGIVSIISGMFLPILLDTESLSLVAAIAAWGFTLSLLTVAGALNIDVPEIRLFLGTSGAISFLLGMVTACAEPSEPAAIKWVLVHAVAQGYLMAALAGKLKLENDRSRS
jgi:uncharacterized membrane protein HdeD (DUF308 family)